MRLAALLAAAFTTAVQPDDRLEFGVATPVGQVVDSELDEISGLASSRRRAGVLWAVNDSGNGPVLYAVATNGAVLGRFRPVGFPNRDWEDLASFAFKGEPYLLVADVGDNAAVHDTCALAAIPEPDLAGADPKNTVDVKPAWILRFRYEDGPRDVESVAVDAAAGRVLLVSKRAKPPALYELPLVPPNAPAPSVARKVADIASIPPPPGEDLKGTVLDAFLAQPTAADLSDDGRKLVVLTYLHAWLFERGADETWPAALARPPTRIELPHPRTGQLKYREAICFAGTNGTIYITSERSPAPIVRLDPKAR